MLVLTCLLGRGQERRARDAKNRDAENRPFLGRGLGRGGGCCRYTDLNTQVGALKNVIETQSQEITTLETYLVIYII